MRRPRCPTSSPPCSPRRARWPMRSSPPRTRLPGAARDAALGLARLCQGDLQGMFDGPTTGGLDFDAPVVVLDLADVYSSEALAIFMACATAFMQATLTTHRNVTTGAPPKVISVVDEAWRVLSELGLGEWLQSSFKLARQHGQQNIIVMHRFSDLTAAGAAGSRESRLAEGLLSDAGTRVVYRQNESEAPLAAQLLGLTETESRAAAGAGARRGDLEGRPTLVLRLPPDLRARGATRRHRRRHGPAPPTRARHSECPAHNARATRARRRRRVRRLGRARRADWASSGSGAAWRDCCSATAGRAASRSPTTPASPCRCRVISAIPAPRGPFRRGASSPARSRSTRCSPRCSRRRRRSSPRCSRALVAWDCGPGAQPASRSSRWARAGDVRRLVVRAPSSGRLVLGRVAGRLVAAEQRHSVIVIAPTQSGKTTGLAVPAVLEWEGPVLACSVKTDLLRDTLARRARLGDVKVFDPTAITGLPARRLEPAGRLAHLAGRARDRRPPRRLRAAGARQRRSELLEPGRRALPRPPALRRRQHPPHHGRRRPLGRHRRPRTNHQRPRRRTVGATAHPRRPRRTRRPRNIGRDLAQRRPPALLAGHDRRPRAEGLRRPHRPRMLARGRTHRRLALGRQRQHRLPVRHRHRPSPPATAVRHPHRRDHQRGLRPLRAHRPTHRSAPAGRPG